MLTRRFYQSIAAAVNHPVDQSRPRLSVAALYRFTHFADCASMRAPLEKVCREHEVRGTLLLAPEGINGTIAGTPRGVASVLDHVRALTDCADLDVKLSSASTMPFHRTKVRLKREIVTMGVSGIDPRASAGTYVEPQDWNRLISAPETIVIDARNAYEVAIGTFSGAVNPKISSFREFPDWFRRMRADLLGDGRPPKVAMFCTGGIRCEKSTAFLKQEGVEDVYHLKGGILSYLATVGESASLWEGECFVFDQRTAIRHGLQPGTHDICHACRRPVSRRDLASPHYEAGVSCAACHPERTHEQRASYRERHRQETLAAARGRSHVGLRQAKRSTAHADLS